MSNLNLHNLPKPTFGPMVAWSAEEPEMGTTPEFIEIEGQRFTWNPEQGCYDGLYIEPYLADGTLTEDSYYEIEA